MPDDLIHSVRLEERLQVLNARVAVGGEQLFCALPASPGARHEPGHIPRDGAYAYVLESFQTSPLSVRSRFDNEASP